MLSAYLLFFISGLFSGFLAGLMGVGGGLITVPTVIFFASWLFIPEQHVMHVALATSLTVMVLTSSLSAYHHLINIQLKWSQWLVVLLPLGAGAVAGAMFAEQLTSALLMTIFAWICLLIALQMLISPAWAATREFVIVHPESPLLLLLIGFWAALSGTGGGTLTVPYFNARGLVLNRAISLSAVCGVPIALVGAMSYFLVSQHQLLGENYLGYVHWPAMLCIAAGSVLTIKLGARMAYRLPVKLLKKLFAMVLFAIAIKLAWR